MTPPEAYGEQGWLCAVPPLGGRADRARAARALGRAIASAWKDADVIVGGTSVLAINGREPIAPTRLTEIARATAQSPDEREQTGATVRTHHVEVVYDGEDLEAVAGATGMSIEAVIEAHSGVSYICEVTGFLPGFGYLGSLDPRLELPRRTTPRRRVAPNSVAIAGPYSGIYPGCSPGGWHLLGRAVRATLFDPSRVPAALIAVGDRVRFRRVTASSSTRPPAPPTAPAVADPQIEIVFAPALATVQDRGRRGQRRAGIPWSGAWDVVTHDAANAALGNDPGAASIEIPHDRLVFRALRALRFSIDGDQPRAASAGEMVEVEAGPRAVRYLALAGGIDVPEVLGSRSTLLAAELGGLEGRALRKGDRLAVGPAGEQRTPRVGMPPADATPLGVVLRTGPDVRAAWIAALTGESFEISAQMDRVGTRLLGGLPEAGSLPPPSHGQAAPEPVLPGAVQVTPDGSMVVLGPDAAVTGGYPVIAVLTEDARAAFARLRPGEKARFTRCAPSF